MNLSLKNFSYDDPYHISDIIYEEALNVTFFGLTVSVCGVNAIQMHPHGCQGI